MCLTEFDEVKYAEQLREEGIEVGAIKTLVSFIKVGLITEDAAAEVADMSLSDFRKAAAHYCI